MLFAIPTTAFAYDTYVGLKIESVNNPNAANPTTWCLAAGPTTMTIKHGVTELNTVTETTETCPGGTIWSGLVTLTASETYTIGLITPNYPGPGVHVENGYAWYGTGSSGQTCTSYCASLGGTCVDPGVYDAQISTGDMNAILGENYSTAHCTSDGAPSMHCNNLYYYTQCTPDYSTCDQIGVGHCRFCSCTGLGLNFTFTFTAPAA